MMVTKHLKNPPWAAGLPWGLIGRASKDHGLPPELIAAVIQTESLGNPAAYRYEAHYKYLYHPNRLALELRVPPEFMEFMQKTSYGLCQVMGGVAYELGLSKDGDYPIPPVLLQPEMGIKYGCLALKRIIDSHRHYRVNPNNPDDIYAAYNAGSVRKFADFRYKNYKHVNRFSKLYRDLTGEPV